MRPLEEFAPADRAEIDRLASAPDPPPKWIFFGHPDDPYPLAKMESRAWLEWHRRRGRDPDEDREPISAAVRAAVIRRDGFVCHLCGGRVPKGDVHLDHVVPWSKGGPSNLTNLRVAHSRCNLRKGNRS